MYENNFSYVCKLKEILKIYWKEISWKKKFRARISVEGIVLPKSHLPVLVRVYLSKDPRKYLKESCSRFLFWIASCNTILLSHPDRHSGNPGPNQKPLAEGKNCLCCPGLRTNLGRVETKRPAMPNSVNWGQKNSISLTAELIMRPQADQFKAHQI